MKKALIKFTEFLKGLIGCELDNEFLDDMDFHERGSVLGHIKICQKIDKEHDTIANNSACRKSKVL